MSIWQKKRNCPVVPLNLLSAGANTAHGTYSVYGKEKTKQTNKQNPPSETKPEKPLSLFLGNTITKNYQDNFFP